ncbi:MAG: hypothetical protein H8E74_03995 [Gammaproteobacteria bacterium]|nr:hypothetical protein [Gammaproteobacteria bacterium]MBL6911655.1 hypothetical protein [Candidatus Neomarinimicrobiota bacterium]
MRIEPKNIIFEDFIDFKPNLTPYHIFKLGSFGGTYWRPIYSETNKKSYSNLHLDLPREWWKTIDDQCLISEKENLTLNRYKVHSGTNLEYWESKNWINPIDPYGWVQWYCHFYNGRRSSDDMRQIQRWSNFTGKNGRWKLRLISLILKKSAKYNDESISPVIRQALQHWGYQLTEKDFEEALWNR